MPTGISPVTHMLRRVASTDFLEIVDQRRAPKRSASEPPSRSRYPPLPEDPLNSDIQALPVIQPPPSQLTTRGEHRFLHPSTPSTFPLTPRYHQAHKVLILRHGKARRMQVDQTEYDGYSGLGDLDQPPPSSDTSASNCSSEITLCGALADSYLT